MPFGPYDDRYGIARHVASNVLYQYGVQLSGAFIGSRWKTSGSAYRGAGIKAREEAEEAAKKKDNMPFTAGESKKRKLSEASAAKILRELKYHKAKSVPLKGKAPSRGGPGLSQGKAVKGRKSGKKSKKSKKNEAIGQYLKRGSVFTEESGRTVSDAQCSYAGAGPSTLQIMKGFSRALVREVCKKAGYEFNNWDEIMYITDAPLRLRVYYQIEGASATAFFDVLTTAATTTFSGLADSVYSNIESTFIRNSWQLIDVILYASGPATLDDIQIARLPMGNYSVSVLCKAKLRIQNQSKARSTDESTDSIFSNPITGKVYWANGNEFEQKARVVGASEAHVLQMGTGGYCEGTASTSFAGQTQYAKPPPGGLFKGVKKSGRTALNPGDVTTFLSSRAMHLSIQQFIVKLGDAAHVNAKGRTTLGESVLVSYEKSMDTRDGAEQPCVLGVQTDITTAVMLVKKKGSRTAIINNIL